MCRHRCPEGRGHGHTFGEGVGDERDWVGRVNYLLASRIKSTSDNAFKSSHITLAQPFNKIILLVSV